MFTLDISAEHMFSMLIFALPYAIALLEVVLLLTGYSASQLTSGRHLYNKYQYFTDNTLLQISLFPRGTVCNRGIPSGNLYIHTCADTLLF